MARAIEKLDKNSSINPVAFFEVNAKDAARPLSISMFL
jgi:hypothetical protein